jgi:hypothetical protein
MIIKLTLIGLIIVLVAVIALSYYNNKECFEDITNQFNASCTDSCESGIQSKDGSAILIMVKKLNPNTNPDPYVKKQRDMITGSLLLKVKSDQGISTVWRAIPCDKGANPPYTANITDNGRLVIKNNADKEVWASSKSAAMKGSKPYQLVLINKNDKNESTDQLRIIDQHGTPVWSAASPDSPDSFKPCDSSDPSDGKENQCMMGQCTFPLRTNNFMLNLDTDMGILTLHSNLDDSDSIIGKARDMGQNGPYTVSLTNKGDLTMLNSIGNMVWKADVYRRNNNPKMDGTYQLVLAEDGSLSIRAGDGNVIWEAEPQPMPTPMPMPDPRRRRPSDPYDPSSGSMPDPTDITPDNQMSDMGSMTMALKYKSDLLKDLKKVVRNELIANRMTKRLKRDDRDDSDANCDANSDANSDAMAQGREYGCHRQDTYRCPKNPDGSCPPVPDMSDYIKKDSIPCFGCSLDY